MKEAIQTMLKMAKAAQAKAYAPYSNFPVGACIRSENDELFAGCNVENASYPVGHCAEVTAIGTMVANGQRIIKDMVIVGSAEGFCAPCGACRQVINEFSTDKTKIHLINEKGEQKIMTLQELLPEAFGPESWRNDES